MQEKLQRQLLWVAGRHHVGEVILTWVWNGLGIEVSKSPEITLFQRYREHYSSLSYGDLSQIQQLEIPVQLHSRRDEVVRLIKEILADKSFSYRGDYTTFLKTTLVLLTGDASNFKLAKPGAIHKARWMMKGIIAEEVVLTSDKIKSELPKNLILTDSQLKKIKCFVQFIAIVYIPWWITCPVAADAPVNDLKLLTAILEYPNKVVSTSALNALKRHLWYLSEELVPLALFSS